jgi:hypothetical protein
LRPAAPVPRPGSKMVIHRRRWGWRFFPQNPKQLQCVDII